jgi:PAS domain S-box-containing protein
MQDDIQPINEAARLEALKAYHILDTLGEEAYDRLTKLASLICETPISLVTLIDDDRQWFKSKQGLTITETPREQAFCRYAILQPSLFEVEDAVIDERFKNNPLVTGEPNIRFYAGYPLIDNKGFALGTLCVIDRIPRKLNANQQESLALLAKEVMSLITEKRQREELENFEKLFTMSNDMIGVAATDGFFKRINPAFEKVLGWQEAIFLSSSFFEFIHPDDIVSTENEIRKLAAGEITINFVNRFRARDGSYKIIQWVATPEPQSGYLFSIGRDITSEKIKEQEIKASESKFRSFFENSQGLMCTHDMNGSFISINTAGAELLGYAPSELLEKTLFDIVPAAHHPGILAYLAEIKKTGRSKGLMTTRHKNGSVKVWLYNNTVEKDGEGDLYVIGNSVDISDRLRLEKDLQRTKEILENTNQIARIGAWEIIPGKNKIYWSPVTCQIHEVPENFVPDLATAFQFYKEGESRQLIEGAIAKAMENGGSWDIELQLITARGNEKWVRALGEAEMVQGKCKRLFGAFQDIDEQKKIKLALQINEAKYRAFFDNSPVGIAINRHSDGKFIDGNQALYQMIGYTEAEYRQLSHHDVTPARYDADEVKHRQSLTDTGRYGPYEKVYLHKDGHAIPVLLNGIRFTDESGEERVYSVIQDISERKQIEKELIVEKARLSAFVENAPAAVAMFDRDVKYVAISNRWLEEYQLVGKNIIGLSHYEVFPNISKEWKDIHTRCLAGAIEKREEDIWRPPGWTHDQHLRWEVRPWYLFDGSIGGIMMFSQDITEICLQRDELKAAKKTAEQASLAKSEFLASMSHEIRTPLNGVIGFTDLILKTRLDETQQQYLSIVNQSANTLLSIINDILDFSKIEAGKLELEMEKCDLYEIASQAADMISFQVKKKRLEMLLNISTELPRFIWTDSVRLKQILINLLSNASKFTEQGEIELKIESLGNVSDKEVLIRFEVRDTGIGIREDKQKKIFEAFSQEDGTVTKRYGGTGLGLTISNRLLALMGSQLQLKSVAGKGSSFYFDLRLTAEQGDPTRWENISSIKKVLIVDDNENNRTIITQMLLLQNIHADLAQNGIEALQILGTGKKYDVILTDYNMPIMDGLETIQKIRKNFFATAEEQPIILLSSSSDDENLVRKCQDLQVSLRLVKPIKMQDLYTALSRLGLQKEGQEVAPAGNMPLANLNAMRILIAEDGAVNMLLARTIIQRIAPNAEIIEAKNGKVALNICKKQMPDFILMDIQMPEMNGYEATRNIRLLEKGKQVPIIAVTAGNVKGEREICLEAGMNDFIAKPIIEETVRTVFNKWAVLTQASPLVAGPDTVMDNIDEHLDLNKLRAIVGEDDAMMKVFLSSIETEIQKSILELEENFRQKDLQALKSGGHKLKGTTLTAGLGLLSLLARQIDSLTEFDEKAIASLLAVTRQETETIVQIIGNLSEK